MPGLRPTEMFWFIFSACRFCLRVCHLSKVVALFVTHIFFTYTCYFHIILFFDFPLSLFVFTFILIATYTASESPLLITLSKLSYLLTYSPLFCLKLIQILDSVGLANKRLMDQFFLRCPIMKYKIYLTFWEKKCPLPFFL